MFSSFEVAQCWVVQPCNSCWSPGNRSRRHPLDNYLLIWSDGARENQAALSSSF